LFLILYYLFCLLLLIFFFRLSFLSGKIFRESFAGVNVVAENESESHTTDQTDIVDNLHYSLESASSFKEHLHSHTLDYHDILINLLLGCSYDTDNDVSLCLPQRAWRMAPTTSLVVRRGDFRFPPVVQCVGRACGLSTLDRP
jgi:hypothetical protein